MKVLEVNIPTHWAWTQRKTILVEAFGWELRQLCIFVSLYDLYKLHRVDVELTESMINRLSMSGIESNIIDSLRNIMQEQEQEEIGKCT